MYEDRTQNYDPELHEDISYIIHTSPAISFYSHVQPITYLQTQLVRLKGNNCI